MDAVQRVQKGLDRNGLINSWNSLNEQTDYVRGLILTEAKKDWESKPSNGEWNEYLYDFQISGKSIGREHASRLIKMAGEKAELSLIKGSRVFKHTDGLTETEAELTLPESASCQERLRGENVIQKARNYQEIKEATNNDNPTVVEIREFNKAKDEASNKMKQHQEARALPKVDKPDPFTSEEEIDFEAWILNEHGIDVIHGRPKGVSAIYALKDENVNVLFSKLDDWKIAYKTMAKLLHPDNGGDALSMGMLNDFKELMNSLAKIKKIVEWENRVEELKIVYSTPR